MKTMNMISRRSFLKATAAAAGVSALGLTRWGSPRWFRCHPRPSHPAPLPALPVPLPRLLKQARPLRWASSTMWIMHP